MLERVNIFQSAGVPLFAWTNDQLMETELEKRYPTIEHLATLIPVLLQFSQSTLHHKMEFINLDNGGFLLITAAHDLACVGIFSQGDSRWRARRILRKIITIFWKRYGGTA